MNLHHQLKCPEQLQGHFWLWIKVQSTLLGHQQWWQATGLLFHSVNKDPEFCILWSFHSIHPCVSLYIWWESLLWWRFQWWVPSPVSRSVSCCHRWSAKEVPSLWANWPCQLFDHLSYPKLFLHLKKVKDGDAVFTFIWLSHLHERSWWWLFTHDRSLSSSAKFLYGSTRCWVKMVGCDAGGITWNAWPGAL